MATDLYGLEASGLPPEMIARLQGLTRQQAIAQAMMQQAQQAPEAGQVKGRFQGVTSPLEHVGKLVQAALAGQDMRGAQKGREALAGEATQGRQAAIEAVMKKFRGSPEVPYNDTLGSEPPQGPVDPGMKADPRGAIMDARMNPFLANAKWVDSMESNLNRTEARADQQTFQGQQALQAQAARAADRAMQLEAKKAEMEARLADKALDRASREALMQSQQAIQREIALARTEATKLAAQARGDAVRDKADAKTEQMGQAKKMVSGLLGELSGYYDDLSTKGAVVDTKKSGVANAAASVRASAPGQILGGIVGTEEQTVRDKIKQTSPMLMNAIRQATAMGARGLDSNTELKFYLQAVTDPAKSIQFNKAALKILDDAYGLGMGVKGVDDGAVKGLKDEFARSQGGAAPAAGVPAGVDPADWAAMTPEEKALWR